MKNSFHNQESNAVQIMKFFKNNFLILLINPIIFKKHRQKIEIKSVFNKKKYKKKTIKLVNLILLINNKISNNKIKSILLLKKFHCVAE